MAPAPHPPPQPQTTKGQPCPSPVPRTWCLGPTCTQTTCDATSRRSAWHFHEFPRPAPGAHTRRRHTWMNKGPASGECLSESSTLAVPDISGPCEQSTSPVPRRATARATPQVRSPSSHSRSKGVSKRGPRRWGLQTGISDFYEFPTANFAAPSGIMCVGAKGCPHIINRGTR